MTQCRNADLVVVLGSSLSVPTVRNVLECSIRTNGSKCSGMFHPYQRLEMFSNVPSAPTVRNVQSVPTVRSVLECSIHANGCKCSRMFQSSFVKCSIDKPSYVLSNVLSKVLSEMFLRMLCGMFDLVVVLSSRLSVPCFHLDGML